MRVHGAAAARLRWVSAASAALGATAILAVVLLSRDEPRPAGSSWIDGARSPALPAAVLLVLGAGAAAAAWVQAVQERPDRRLPGARGRVAPDAPATVLTVALALSPSAWVAVALTAGTASTWLARRQSPAKSGFATAQSLAASAGAVLVVVGVGVLTGAHDPAALADDPHSGSRLTVSALAVVLGLLAALLIETAGSSSVVAAVSRRTWLQVLVSALPRAAPAWAGAGALGLLVSWLLRSDPVALVGLSVPALLLLNRSVRDRSFQAASGVFAELARGYAGSTPSQDQRVRVVLQAAARLLGGADVELVTLTADGVVRYRGDEAGVWLRTCVPAEGFSAAWVLRALASRHGYARGVTPDARPWCCAVLGPVSAPSAVLGAWRPAGSARFSARELAVAGVLAEQAESWLAGDQAATSPVWSAIPGASEAAEPALGLLADAALRLARTAQAPGGLDPVGNVVTELHEVELAAARLIGVLAEPAAVRPLVRSGAVGWPAGAQVVPTARASQEWTTSGLLPVRG